MQTPNDPDKFADPKSKSAQDVQFRQELNAYIQHTIGTPVQQMQNFAKYTPRQSMARFLARYEIFKQVLEVPGSVVECGVLFGGGLMAYAQFSAILEPVNYTRKIIGFDTFAGFPELHAHDTQATAATEAVTGGLAVDSHADLQEAARIYDMNRTLGHLPKVELVKGDMAHTVPQYLADNPHLIVSLLYIDVDVYEPTKIALEHFYPRIPKGGIVAFDELNADRWPGETIATMEALGLNNLRLRRFPWDTHVSYAVVE